MSFEHPLRNAYIWEAQRSPWSNTIAYYPLNSSTTVNDMSGNGYTLTNDWTSFWTYGWVDCAYFPSRNTKILYRDLPMTWNNPFTVNLYAYGTGYGGSQMWFFFMFGDLGSSWRNLGFWFEYSWPVWVLSTWWNTKRFWEVHYNEWKMVTVTNNNWSVKIYLNWDKSLDDTLSFNIASEHFTIWSTYRWNNSWNYQAFKWYLSEFIIENRVWTQDEITRYYNKTKWTYGLS